MNRNLTYHLSPDGGRDRAGRAYDDLSSPVTFGSPPSTGMITAPVAILGDSFLLPATRYLPAVFTNGTGVFYAGLASDPDPIVATMVGARTVVVEAVERNIADGSAAFLQPQVIADIQVMLANHPMR
jgi:hypothetical protein